MRTPIKLLTALCLALGANALSQTTWNFTGGNVSFTWEDTTKWNPASVPDAVNGVDPVVTINSNSGSTKTITIGASHTIGSLSAGRGGGNSTRMWVFSGSGVLTLDTGTVGGVPYVGQNSTYGYQAYPMVLAGTEGVRFGGGGTELISGNNTFTGDVQLTHSTTQIGNVNALPHGSRTGNITFVNNSGYGTLDLNGTSFTINGMSSPAAGAGTVTTASGTPTLTLGDNDQGGTFQGVIQDGSGKVSLAKIGAGEEVLNGVNTYSGSTTISAGRLTGVTGGSCANSAFSVGGTGTLNVQYTGSDASWSANSLTFTASSATLNIDLGANSPSTIVAPLTLNSGITFGASPTFNITGSTTIANGTYPLIYYTTSISSIGNLPETVNLPGGGIGLLQNDSGSETIQLVVGGPLPPNIHWATGDGTWDMGLYNWKGAIGSTNYVEGVPVEFKDADATGNPTVMLNIPVQPASVAVSASSHDYTLTGSGAINGAASLSKSGTSALTVDLANDYTGGTTMAGGTLNLKQASSLGDITSPLTIFGGTLDNTKGIALTTLNYTQAWNGDFTFTGSSDLNLGTGDVVLGSARVITVNANNLIIGGNIAGTGYGVTKAGNGTLQLNAGLNTSSAATLTVNAGTLQLGYGGDTAHHFNGDTRLVGGTLLLTDPNALLNSALNMLAGDTGSLSFGSLTTAILGSLKGSRNLVLQNASSGAVELQVGNAVGDNDSYTGTLSGPGSLTKIGTGPWQLGAGGAGSGIYSGDTHVVSGSLRPGANNVFPYGAGMGNLMVSSPGILDVLDRSALTFNGLNGDGTINDSDNGRSSAGNPFTFTVGAGDASGSFSGIIEEVATSGKHSASISLAKTGAGTQTLSGVNTYSGTTTVNGGILRVDSPGSLPPTAVTVNSSGTLGGTGTINGPVTVNAGGSISAGDSPGMLTLANGLDLSAGGTNIWELADLTDDATGTAGTDFDQIVLTGGTLTLGGASTLSIHFTGTATPPDSSNPFWQTAHSWTIISASGAASAFAAIQNGDYPAGYFTTSAQAGGIVLTFTLGIRPTPVTSFSIATGPGSDLTLGYSGGSGSQFVLLQTNNITAPLTNWTRIQTNTSSPGTFTITPGADPQEFYRIKSE